MNYFQMRALIPQAVKFAGLIDSRRICQSHVKTLFEAADKITPQFKAVFSPTEQIMRALTPVNPLAGGV